MVHENLYRKMLSEKGARSETGNVTTTFKEYGRTQGAHEGPRGLTRQEC